MTNSHENVRFASALSTANNSQAAADEIAQEAANKLGGDADLAVLFISPHHIENLQLSVERVAQMCGTDRIIGCAGESIVGANNQSSYEFEYQPAMSLLAGRLPRTNISLMRLQFENSPEGGAFVGWPTELPDPWPDDAALLMIGDPFTFPADVLLHRMAEDRPKTPVIGGMASAASTPGDNRLIYGTQVIQDGAVAMMLHGGVKLRAVVSQGCRPIGRHFVITKAERNVIYELGGKPAMVQLRAVFESLSTSEQRMVQRGLHLGRVVDEYRDHFEQGDFIIRNVMGVDEETGAIAIGDFVRPGQTVQFQIRDGTTADHEMKQLLSAAAKAGAEPAGALLFTCNGRGMRMFEEPHHDAAAIRQTFGNLPLAGFFAAGELGPIGGANFLHGFTASIALFEAANEKAA